MGSPRGLDYYILLFFFFLVYRRLRLSVGENIESYGDVCLPSAFSSQNARKPSDSGKYGFKIVAAAVDHRRADDWLATCPTYIRYDNNDD